MKWLTDLFGGAPPIEKRSEEPPAAKTPRKNKARAIRPPSLLRDFAQNVGGATATVDDFDGGAPRDDGLIGRVTFQLDGATARLVLKSYDGVTIAWLETKCAAHGDFNLEHGAPESSNEVSPEEPRFYLTRECYVSGPRARNEVARILTLSPENRLRLFAMALQVDLVKLDEQVLGVVLGDVFALADIFEAPQKGGAYLTQLTNELVFLAKQFPTLSKDIAELAEARTCRFCHASFVFAPEKPACTACGAPASNASRMPPPPAGVIPDDPLEEIDEADADEREDREERRTKRLELSRALASLVEKPRIVEEPERARTFVEYVLSGRAYRAKIMDEYVGIRTDAPGVKGDFYLGYSTQDIGGEKVAEHFWRESEKCFFFSKHCRVRSGHGTKEALRLGSLPSTFRARLVDYCERFESASQLEDERLAIGLGEHVHREERGVELIVAVSRDLGAIADAFPRNWNDRDPVHFTLKACNHCGWSSFAEEGQGGCMHCGAPFSSS